MTSERQRLFFALWPDPEVRVRLQRLTRGLQPQRGRPVAADKLHVTLAFLGSVDGAIRECLEHAADGVRRAPFSLHLDRLGHWSRPQVLWLGCSETPPELLGLVADLAAAMRSCDREPETRPYHAHLTLARKVRRVRLPEAVEPVDWPVERFVLVQSDTLPEGAVYQVLRSWLLRP